MSLRVRVHVRQAASDKQRQECSAPARRGSNGPFMFHSPVYPSPRTPVLAVSSSSPWYNLSLIESQACASSFVVYPHTMRSKRVIIDGHPIVSECCFAKLPEHNPSLLNKSGYDPSSLFLFSVHCLAFACNCMPPAPAALHPLERWYTDPHSLSQHGCQRS